MKEKNIIDYHFETHQKFFCIDSYANGNTSDQDYDPGDDFSDDEEEDLIKNQKKSIPDDILWKMCKIGISFASLSEVLKLAYSVVNEENNFHLSASHLFKSYQRISETKGITYEDEIRSKASIGSVCFDHHSMKQLSGKFMPKEHRLAIVWHSNSKDKLISIDKMRNKTAASQAALILRSLEFFGLENHAVAAVCDNERTNTGIDNGTCVVLEDLLDRYLLRTMCKHHIYEIVVKDVYGYLFSSSAPTNLFHPILVEKWSELKQSDFPFIGFGDELDEDFVDLDENQVETYEYFKEIAVQQLETHSTQLFLRDDYKEITKVSLKFLTSQRENLTKSNQTQFDGLQNPSNARFMATSIQALKCFLFRHHLNWDSNERMKISENLPRFCLFLSLMYVRYWNRSNIVFDAGINDLKFLQELEDYADLDHGTSHVAIEALSRHLYYLSEELIVLFLFSDKASISEKNRFAARLLQIDDDMPERDLRSNHIKYNGNVTDWRRKQITDFIGQRSLFLFRALDISLDFLNIDAEQWSSNALYCSGKAKISATLICVNDNTERVISACKNKYKRQRCKNESSFNRSMIENYLTE